MILTDNTQLKAASISLSFHVFLSHLLFMSAKSSIISILDHLNL